MSTGDQNYSSGMKAKEFWIYHTYDGSHVYDAKIEGYCIADLHVVEKIAFDKAIEALKACCKLESDGFGGWVSEEFEPEEVLAGRRVLVELGYKLEDRNGK